MVRHAKAAAAGLLLMALITGCNEVSDGPADIRWDREICHRCAMAISEKGFAAQILGGPSGTATQHYSFDDIGCAVIWLDQQGWQDSPSTQFWVADGDSGQWIDARSARYRNARISPMGYGLAATTAADPGTLSYSQARDHIYRIEEKYNVHGGNAHPEPAATEVIR